MHRYTETETEPEPVLAMWEGYIFSQNKLSASLQRKTIVLLQNYGRNVTFSWINLHIQSVITQCEVYTVCELFCSKASSRRHKCKCKHETTRWGWRSVYSYRGLTWSRCHDNMTTTGGYFSPLWSNMIRHLSQNHSSRWMAKPEFTSLLNAAASSLSS